MGKGWTLVIRSITAYASLVALLFFFGSAGCGTTSPGSSRHLMSQDAAGPTLPLKIVVDESCRTITSISTLSKMDKRPLLIVGGPAARSLLGSEGFMTAIRGKFAAGEAFEEVAKHMAGSDDDSAGMRLTLVRFDHFADIYDVKSPGPSLKGTLEFKAEFLNGGRATLSQYYFDWAKGKRTTFLPSEERDTLRELLENALWHWGQEILAVCPQPASASCLINDFPEPKSGEFSLKSANYSYRIFQQIEAQSQTLQDSQNEKGELSAERGSEGTDGQKISNGISRVPEIGGGGKVGARQRE